MGAGVKRGMRDGCRRPALGRVMLSLLLLVVLGCQTKPKWETAGSPRSHDVERLLSSEGPAAMSRDSRPEGAPPVPIRERLRPCCAFGAQIGVGVAGIPVPGVELENVLGPEGVGPHRYDAGVLVLESDRGDGYAVDENNGQIYSCRGGFIDTAHVRDYIDWAMYLSAQFGAHLDNGVTVELPEEAGKRRFVLRPVPADKIALYTRRELFSAFAQWGAWQISVWHEIATWFGFTAVAGFSELASSFSPEDLYSNLLGIKILDGIIADKTGRTEHLYNESVAVWLDEILLHLGAVSAETGHEVMMSVDQHWWDSQQRLPDPRLTLRRNLDIGNPIEPWLVPDRFLTQKLRDRLDHECKTGMEPQLLQRSNGVGDLVLSDYLTLEIEVDRQLLEVEPFSILGMPITQTQFPALVEYIRMEIEKVAGAEGYTPD